VSDLDKIQAQIGSDALATFAHGSGARILSHLKSRYVERQLFVKGDTDETLYRLGSADVIRYLERLMNTAKGDPQ
jgi:hypothetical protein